MKKIVFSSLLFVFLGCNSNTENKKQEMNNTNIGTVERLDSALDKIISPNAKIEIIADGFDWSEGPLWIEKYKMLLFS